MISKECFSSDWIQNIRQKIGKVDPTLLEKTIYAIELFGQLCENRVDFVFKGGTSLLLLIPQWGRFSTDIDIVCEESEEKLHHVFDTIIKSKNFTRWAENPRKPSGVPKKHFKFFYQSVINQREDYVLLDLLNESYSFQDIQTVKIKIDYVKISNAVSVKIPSLNWLIGDKLTAFAPNTIGILYKSDKALSIMKQLYDLGELFPFVTDIQSISDSYHTFLGFQNKYLSTSFSDQETLADTLEACYLICQIDLKSSIENHYTSILREGVNKINSHLISKKYTLNDSKIAASRTALLATILTNSQYKFVKNYIKFEPEDINQFQTYELRNQYQRLNRLKYILPEAFYYWHLISKLENERE